MAIGGLIYLEKLKMLVFIVWYLSIGIGFAMAFHMCPIVDRPPADRLTEILVALCIIFLHPFLIAAAIVDTLGEL